MPLYERSVGFASVQSLCAFISGFLAFLALPVASTLSISTTFSKAHQPPRPAPPHLPPLLKVRCCRLKKFGRLPEGLSLHQPFQNSTIPLAFRRARACVCLYGFVFALPPRFPYCNRLYALICFHIRTIPCFAPPHLPYERSVGFASLRNSGRSTSGIHARPLLKVRCCRPKKFGRLPEGLPHHHPSLAPTLPKPHYPPRFS